MTRPEQMIVSPGVGGHRLAYVRLIAERMLACGRAPHLVAELGARRTPEFDLHLSHLAAELRVTELRAVTYGSVSEIAHDNALPVIFLEGDRAIWRAAICGASRLGGATLLVMRPRGQSVNVFSRSLQSFAKAVGRATARRRKGVLVYELVGSSAEAGKNQVADPVVFRGTRERAAELRREWNDTVGRQVDRWVGVVGAINGRKNVDLVSLSLVAVAKEIDVGFVLAGRVAEQDQVVKQWLAPLVDSGIPVIQIDRLMSDVDLDSIVMSLDCVVLAHSNEGPSGIFAKAYVAGTQIVAAGASSLRSDADQADGLATWVPLRAADISKAIQARVNTSAQVPVHPDQFSHFGATLVQ